MIRLEPRPEPSRAMIYLSPLLAGFNAGGGHDCIYSAWPATY